MKFNDNLCALEWQPLVKLSANFLLNWVSVSHQNEWLQCRFEWFSQTRILVKITHYCHSSGVKTLILSVHVTKSTEAFSLNLSVFTSHSVSSSAPKVQANDEDALRPDPIAVSISTSHSRSDARMDARKRERSAREIPTSEILFEGRCWRCCWRGTFCSYSKDVGTPIHISWDARSSAIMWTLQWRRKQNWNGKETPGEEGKHIVLGFVLFQSCEPWDIHNDERVSWHTSSAFGWCGGNTWGNEWSTL